MTLAKITIATRGAALSGQPYDELGTPGTSCYDIPTLAPCGISELLFMLFPDFGALRFQSCDVVLRVVSETIANTAQLYTWIMSAYEPIETKAKGCNVDSGLQRRLLDPLLEMAVAHRSLCTWSTYT